MKSAKNNNTLDLREFEDEWSAAPGSVIRHAGRIRKHQVPRTRSNAERDRSPNDDRRDSSYPG